MRRMKRTLTTGDVNSLLQTQKAMIRNEMISNYLRSEAFRRHLDHVAEQTDTDIAAAAEEQLAAFKRAIGCSDYRVDEGVFLGIERIPKK